MNSDVAQRYRWQNWLHTILLMAGMLLLLGLIGWLIAGIVGIIWALGTGLVLLLSMSRLSPRLVLYLYGAQRLPPERFGALIDIVAWLAQRAGLGRTPQLYYIPSRAMLAFSVGMQQDTAIAVSDGLLRALDGRELTAVLAHEMGHIQSRDLWVMAMADAISRITSLMALSAYLMMLVYLPLLVFDEIAIPWLLLIVLIFAPTLSALMQLALSRTREFNADVLAVGLTGDPGGLISALSKIEHYQRNWIERLLLPGLRIPWPSLLRTHPLTDERTRRLREMAQQIEHPFDGVQHLESLQMKPLQRKPRRHLSGLWH